MNKTFISGILAASLTLTSISATPVYAERNDDLRNILTGLAIVAIIGAAVDNRGNSNVTVNTPQPQPQNGVIPRHRRNLPSRCVSRVRTRNGPINMFGRRCMQNNYRWTRHLPERCEVTVRTREGRRHGFAARCLRRAGYEFRRPRHN